jgi:hypothetical protein
MDSSYLFSEMVRSGLERAANNAHEFAVLEDGTALTTIFQPAQYDLSSYGLNQTICDPTLQELQLRYLNISKLSLSSNIDYHSGVG